MKEVKDDILLTLEQEVYFNELTDREKQAFNCGVREGDSKFWRRNWFPLLIVQLMIIIFTAWVCSKLILNP